jgi:hypothetical protein
MKIKNKFTSNKGLTNPRIVLNYLGGGKAAEINGEVK